MIKASGKSLTLAPGVTDAIDAATRDITVEHLDARYDLIVVTNVFPYLPDSELLLAISNIARMLNPRGILIHNEPRPVLAEALARLEMAFCRADRVSSPTWTRALRCTTRPGCTGRRDGLTSRAVSI